jgi:hypothetical protein
MRYVIYTVNEKQDYVMLGLVETDEQVKEALADQIRKAPAANVQVCMVN